MFEKKIRKQLAEAMSFVINEKGLGFSKDAKYGFFEHEYTDMKNNKHYELFVCVGYSEGTEIATLGRGYLREIENLPLHEMKKIATDVLKSDGLFEGLDYSECTRKQ